MKIKDLQPLHNLLLAFLVSTTLFAATAFFFDKDMARYSLVLSGKGVEREKSVIAGTIGLYNAILTDIYVSGGVPALLNEFPATKTLRHGLFRDIGFIRDSGRVLVYDMADTHIVDIRLSSPHSAEAVVFEEWNYVYQRSSDRRPVTNIKGLGQGFRYSLVRQDGRWMVSAWDPVDVADPDEKEFAY